MKIRYDVPEIVWNSYQVTGIELSDLEAELKEEPNIWIVQDKLCKKGRPFYIELEESCYEFIETLHDKGEVSE